MEFKQIVMSRYATKKFDGKTVPQDKIDQLLDMIRYAPSSFNIQPWKIRVVTDKDMKKKLAPAAWNQAQIESCSHLLVMCADIGVKKLIDDLEALMIKNGASKEGIKGYIDMMRGFDAKLSDQERLAWSQKQVYIALGNALNGAKSLGLDSCPMEGFSSPDFAKVLNLPKNIVATVLCPVGYPADKPMPKLRFAKEQVFF